MLKEDIDLHSNIFKLIQNYTIFDNPFLSNLHSNIFKLILKSFIIICGTINIYILIYLN